MSNADLIEMAKDAGFRVFGDKIVAADNGISGEASQSIERFAALVAAKEREECAKVCETCENEEPNLRQMWAEADKKAKDWREAGDVKLLEQMHDAWAGLKACGWREIEYCPKDGTRFLAIEAGSTGVFPCYYSGEWPEGSWWVEAHGDLWPSRPVLWKPMPSNAGNERTPD